MIDNLIGHFVITGKAITKLMHYGRPGKVRELENAIMRAATLCEDSMIHPCDLPKEIIRGRQSGSQINGKTKYLRF